MELGSDALVFSRSAMRCETVEQLAALTAQAVRPFGMTASASGMITGPRAVSQNPSHFANWPKGWAELYHTRSFFFRDPIVRWAMLSGAPATWSEVRFSLAPNDVGHEMFEDAENWGFTEGLVTPVRGMDGYLGLVGLGGKRGKLKSDEIAFMTAVSTTAFQRADALFGVLGVAPLPSQFSLREQECILLMRQGFTDREIGHILGIVAETARYHLDNARSKVGARSRAHLTAILADR
jgi:DNA-binding CsgD family transcriptional regulator